MHNMGNEHSIMEVANLIYQQFYIYGCLSKF